MLLRTVQRIWRARAFERAVHTADPRQEVAGPAQSVERPSDGEGHDDSHRGGYGTVAHTSVLYFMQLSGTTVQFVQAGKVRALAVTSRPHPGSPSS
jgi:hypothetical protein